MVIYGAHFVTTVKLANQHPLRLNGVGFRAYSYKDRVCLQLGYSHYLMVYSQAPRARRQRLLVNQEEAQRYLTLRYPDAYRGRGIQSLLMVSRPYKEGKKR